MRSISKTRNYAETVRHTITKNDIHTVRPNKRSREEIAEIDAELTQRANRIGGGYRPIQVEEEEEPEAPEEGELPAEQHTVDTKEDSVIMRGDNLPIVDLSKYHTDGKEAPIYKLIT